MWPSLVANTSDGALSCPRLPVASRFGASTACSMSNGLAAGEGGAEQGALHLLATPGLPAGEEGDYRPEGAESGGAEIDPRGVGADGLVRMAAEVHVAAHRLGEAVEAELSPVRSRGSESTCSRRG